MTSSLSKLTSSRRRFLKHALAAPLIGSGVGLASAASPVAKFQRNERCMSVLKRLRGPMASVTQPYNRDFSIDHGALRAWVDSMCENKAPILFMTYGDSERGFLSEEEIEAVTRTVCSQARGRALVLGGTGEWWTNRTIDFINRVEDSGVDALNVHIGGLCRNEDEIYGAFKEIDSKTQVPLLAVDRKYSLDLMLKLAQLPKVIGDKCHEELYNYHKFIRETRPYHFAVVGAGQMKHFLFGYLIGSPAYLCPITPFAPKIGVDFFNALERGDFVTAKEMTFKYEDALLKVTGKLGYPHCYKSLIHLSGQYKTTLMRSPRTGNTPEQVAELKAFLLKSGMLPS